jgi:cyclo(L-tyrosyl-L-tyrosyl) synthase
MGDSTATLTSEEFEVLPFTTACRDIWEEGDHALIGVSPGNSYFSAQRISALARWAARRFRRIDFVYADLHVDTMFQALGYAPEHARRRASKEIKAVRRRVLRGMEESGPTDQQNQQHQHDQHTMRVHALSDFEHDATYRLLHRRVRHILDVDEEFRRGCERMADLFLGSRLDDGRPPTAEQRRVCLDYIAAELPFFVDTPSILGVPSSVSCYHVLMPLTEVLYGRGGGLRAMRNQAYAVVRPEIPESPEGLERTSHDDRRAA